MTDTDYTEQILTDVRAKIAADDAVLSETKKRRNLVKRVARQFEGALSTFDSGSLAHGTVNKPVSDGDCGVVLDRRTYPELGPDGDDVPPNEIVDEMAETVIEGVRAEYPDATAEVGKRSIVISFNEPLADSDAEVEDQDPSVDLIVALTRADGSGRWIPNTEAGDWDASDPEGHTALLNGPTRVERVHRARTIRLAKSAIKTDEPPTITSFNTEALALEHVDDNDTIAKSLRDLFIDGASDLEQGDTPDPVGVSDPIKLPEGVSREQAVARLRELGDAVGEAIENADDEAVAHAALAKVFPDQLEDDVSEADEVAAALKTGNAGKLTSAFGAGAGSLKRTAAYGGDRETP